MKLIYIKSTMEPKNYSSIRSILKKAQGEKIAPYVFKINDTQTLQEYLDQEKITYEIYQEERKIKTTKQTLTPTHDEPRNERSKHKQIITLLFFLIIGTDFYNCLSKNDNKYENFGSCYKSDT